MLVIVWKYVYFMMFLDYTYIFLKFINLIIYHESITRIGYVIIQTAYYAVGHLDHDSVNGL